VSRHNSKQATVDNLYLQKPSTSTSFGRVRQADRNRLNRNHLESTEFHKFQQALASGSGPGGRWFKSIRPTTRTTSNTPQRERGTVSGYQRGVQADVASNSGSGEGTSRIFPSSTSRVKGFAGRYRTETFCYGPRSCPLYHSGPTRKVPGRRGMTYTEEDQIDEETPSRPCPDK
jgi:hypothetical protein